MFQIPGHNRTDEKIIVGASLGAMGLDVGKESRRAALLRKEGVGGGWIVSQKLRREGASPTKVSKRIRLNSNHA